MGKRILELIAEAVHETWMRGRIDDGWKYGEKRDDELKTHPCIVPYSDLPEKEKDYDRRTACTVMEFLEKHGLHVTKNNG